MWGVLGIIHVAPSYCRNVFFFSSLTLRETPQYTTLGLFFFFFFLGALTGTFFPPLKEQPAMDHPSAAPHLASRAADRSSKQASPPLAANRTQHLSLAPLLAGGSSAAAASSSWRTRSLYATARYVGKFIWWRIVRYGKYLALGAVTATLGGTFLGTLVSGASIFVAPTAAMGFVIAGGLAVAKVSSDEPGGQ